MEEWKKICEEIETGVWEYDNRIYEDDDYEAVIEWLNKIAQEEGE